MVAFMQHCKRGFRYSHIQVFGSESWGNINQLRNKYVDIFGTKDEDTVEGYWTYDEHLLVVLRQQLLHLINLIDYF